MDFGNFLIPLVLVFCIILAVLWLLGRCKYKIIRKNKDNEEEGVIIKLNSGMKIEMCDFIFYCCWSASDVSADVIKYHDKLVVISYQTALTNMEMEECVICKETFISDKQICTLTCKHYFHVTCIVKWLSQQKRCPLCWTEINNVKTATVKTV